MTLPGTSSRGLIASVTCSRVILPSFRNNQLLVAQHVYGVPDEREPVLFLRSALVEDISVGRLVKPDSIVVAYPVPCCFRALPRSGG